LAAGSHVKELIASGKKLLELEKDETQLNKMLDEQLTHLELMAEDVIPEDAEGVEGKQLQLEKMVNTLANEYRLVKKEMFGLVEGLLHETREYK